jgi:hypothetical protein
MAERCPTPDKKRFATAEAAASYALARELGIGALLTPYACPCGWVHLTSAEQIPDRAEPDPTVLTTLRYADHDAFVDVVEADASGRADMPTRIALRAPRIRGRWITTLRAIDARLDRELATRPAGEAWRHRAQAFRHNVRARLTEAEQLRERERAA